MTTANDAELHTRLTSDDAAAAVAAAVELAGRGVQLGTDDLARLRARLDAEADPGRRLTLAHAYLDLLGASAGAAVAAEWMRGRDAELREGAFEALVDYGSAALETLQDLAKDGDRDVRWHAFEAARLLRVPAAVPVLLDGLGDEDFAIRWAASRGLAAVGPDALVPVLEALVRRPPTQQLHRSVRRVLSRIPGGDHAEELTELVESLGHATTVVESGPRAEQLLQKLRRA